MSASSVQLIDLPVFTDGRGSLGVVEEGAAAPFPIRRLFYLFDIEAGAKRGHHAHREQHQLLIMMTGRCRALADDGFHRCEFNLTSARQALYAPPMNWLELTDFSPGAVCAVLTSDRFDEGDYVRDYAEFRRLAGSGAAI